ncbi:hypothetical protein [Nocardioides soli]|uniref:Uncharacterized protein n=1 Tax=Nocardioides soli TaxID=1036020 RepID=A0A7W4Z207_9ACTN|nr:hypothetical protein [Nocardioides soli]MBB3043939.1 hypothetical protein [Nocardioides soli]
MTESDRTLRDELFALYDAMVETDAAHTQATYAADRGTGTTAEEAAAHRAALDARTALHDRINRIGRTTPPEAADTDSPVPAVGDAGAGVGAAR